MASLTIILLFFIFTLLELPAAAQTSPPASSTLGEPITCSLPNTSMISPNYCNAYDEQSMGKQTQNCQGFLTMFEAAPSEDCCTGLNNVAYNRTACICRFTFTPCSSQCVAAAGSSKAVWRNHEFVRPVSHVPYLKVRRNEWRNSNSTLFALVCEAHVPYSEGKSTASTVGAISLAVVFGVLLLAGIIAFAMMLVKKRKAKSNPPVAFEAPPPGGAF